MSPAARPASLGSAGLIAMGLTGLWLLFWRWMLDTPWGFAPVPSSGGLLNIGIACNPGDTWSYLSWVQQYYHGNNLAGLIYTTEPHAARLCLFPLWLIGKIAAWTGLSVIGIYNTAGLIGAMAAVGFFLRAAVALGLPPSARHWAAVAFVTGSGGSWLWHLAHKFAGASPANGGDLVFLDLFPSTTLVAYAYHAVGLALLAALWWTTTELETRRLAGDQARPWLLTTAGVALLLGFSRPYEPVAFLGAWALKTAWHGCQRRREPAQWKNSLTIGSLLFLALAPGIGWSVWVSTQPVWSTFARESLTLGLDRTTWLCTLLGWIVLVILGIGPARRADARLVVLPLSASLLMGIILLGIGPTQAKLASGLILGPLLLAGWGAGRLIAATARFPVLFRIGVCGPTLGALFGIASLFMNLNALKLSGPALVDAELVAIAGHLAAVDRDSPPVVLTDVETGAVLPGLVGVRVWVGHWSLSNHYQAKVGRLRLAGLDPETRPTNAAGAARALNDILADTRFDYALIDRRCANALTVLTRHGWQLLERTGRWSLLQAPPSSP